MQLRVEFQGLKDFQYAIRNAPEVYRREADRLLHDWTDIAAMRAREKARIRTGRLRASIQRRKIGEMQYAVGTDLPYGRFVELGTRPHWILPREAKVLHFYVGGEEVFTPWVYHPGTKPQPYLRPAVEEVTPRLREALAKLYLDLLKRRFRFT